MSWNYIFENNWKRILTNSGTKEHTQKLTIMLLIFVIKNKNKTNGPGNAQELQKLEKKVKRSHVNIVEREKPCKGKTHKNICQHLHLCQIINQVLYKGKARNFHIGEN